MGKGLGKTTGYASDICGNSASVKRQGVIQTEITPIGKEDVGGQGEVTLHNSFQVLSEDMKENKDEESEQAALAASDIL